MKKVILLSLATFIVSFAFISCSDDNAEERIEAAKIVESRSSQDIMNDLYLASDGDIESLARMLQCTPSTIERIRKNETEPTETFEERIKSIATFYYQNDRKYSKLQSILDDEYGWYDSILNFPFHHPYIFWVGIICLIVFAFLPPTTRLANSIIVLCVFVFLIAWVISRFCSPDTIDDKYTDSINPVIEQII